MRLRPCGRGANSRPVAGRYAATKAAAEAIARSYWTSFKLPVIVTRGNNVFGPHQYPEKVIPKFICRLVNGQSCCIHGDGSNSRHYVYVGDVANAFDVVTHSGVNGEIYNIGCHEEFTNMEAPTPPRLPHPWRAGIHRPKRERAPGAGGRAPRARY